MRHSETPGRAPLLELLHCGDPAGSMAPEEADRIVLAIRREIQREKAPAPAPLSWRVALIAACVLVIALVGFWKNAPAPAGDGPRTSPRVEAQISPVGAEPERVSALQEPRAQQIQFRTPGGTRVIWVLTSGNNPERRVL